MRYLVGRLRFVLCFQALLSDSDEAVASVLRLCFFFKIQCEFAVTACVNTVRMIWAVSARWYTVAISGPF